MERIGGLGYIKYQSDDFKMPTPWPGRVVSQRVEMRAIVALVDGGSVQLRKHGAGFQDNINVEWLFHHSHKCQVCELDACVQLGNVNGSPTRENTEPDQGWKRKVSE